MWAKFCSTIYTYLIKQHKIYKEQQYRRKYDIANTANLNHIEDTFLVGPNISIGDYSYINSGRLICGNKSKITIGNNSVIGANSVVVSDVPPYSVYRGVPAKFLKKVVPST